MNQTALDVRTHRVYVDQSGKIEESMNTGIAFSQEGEKAEEISEGIVILQKHKERLKPLARSSLGSTEKYRMKVFACGLFMLTQDYAGSLEEIIVDREWQGKEGMIKNYLYNFYKDNLHLERSGYPEIRTEKVHAAVEGTPTCHELAYEVRETPEDAYIVSDYKFLKGMVLPSAGNGRDA